VVVGDTVTVKFAVASPHELATVCRPGSESVGTVNVTENEPLFTYAFPWVRRRSPSHDSSTESHSLKPLPRAVTVLPGRPLEGFSISFAADS
jgi:hypothetical protein